MNYKRYRKNPVVDFPDQNLFDGHEVNREEHERLLLYVPAGSAAEAYAKKHNLRYELIGAPNN